MKKDTVLNAKHLCRTQHTGVLATHSKKFEGYPLGSIVPFYLTDEGEPVIYISSIAQHTHNIKQKSQVSLTIYNTEADDSQASGRVCILGDAELSNDEALAEQYYAFFPDARGYKNTHDFSFYKINVKTVRYIGGFGDINWIDAGAWMFNKEDWQQDVSGMINHMNEDHQDAMQLILLHQHDVYVKDVTMISAYKEGCHFYAANSVFFIAYPSLCETAMDVRKALVALTNNARDAQMVV